MIKTIQKIFVVSITLLMFSCLFGCSEKEFVLDLGEKLPKYVSDVQYIEDIFDDGIKPYEPIKGYLYDDGTRLAVYEWDRQGKDYEEIIEDEIEEFFPNQKLEYTVLDNWEEPGDFTYGYFMSYLPTGYDDPYYLQNYYFIDDNKVTQLQFWLPATRMDLPGTDYTIDLPLGYDNGTLDKAELEDDAIAKFVPRFDEEYPELNVYCWEKVYDTYEEFAEEELSSLYDMRFYQVYDYVDIYGNDQNVLLSIYDEDDEGTLETNYDITIDMGEENIAFDFFVLIEDEYIRYATPAIVSSIGRKN